MKISRRQFGVLTGGAISSLAISMACRRGNDADGANDGRLVARPRSNLRTLPSGEQSLGLDRERDAILRLPTKSTSDRLPLLVLLHGAGQSADDALHYLGTTAEEAGVAVLAPNSRASTWDAIRGSFGPDVTFLNRALERVFDEVSVDPSRLAVGGFSDGASYSLSLGLINGDLFPRVVAFSPGFVVDGPPHGRPRVFISHGTADPILPIDRCSRLIVPTLKQRGYDVAFREFDGVHEVPTEIAREGMRWVTGE